MSESVTKHFRFQSRSYLTAGWRTCRVSLTSWLTGYTARVSELRSGAVEIPVTLPDGPRYYLSPADFYPLRQHYRGELIGAIKAELQRDAVQSIVDLPYATSVQACDCYIRAHSEREFWPEGYPNAQYDDLGDLSHWQLAASATQ